MLAHEASRGFTVATVRGICVVGSMGEQWTRNVLVHGWGTDLGQHVSLLWRDFFFHFKMGFQMSPCATLKRINMTTDGSDRRAADTFREQLLMLKSLSFIVQPRISRRAKTKDVQSYCVLCTIFILDLALGDLSAISTKTDCASMLIHLLYVDPPKSDEGERKVL